MATIAFHGAARTVTGSRHLIEVGGARILVDCGMFQGSGDLRRRNEEPFPFDPETVDAVVFTHAHLDHLGLYPRARRLGLRCPAFATPATIGLAKIALPDSGRIQEEDARSRAKRGEPAEPLYDEREAEEAARSLIPFGYHVPFDLPGGVSARFRPAGHILGSAFVELTFPDGRILLMGGDLGRVGTPIIRDPERVESADHLVIESTYGDRDHAMEAVGPKLASILRRAADEGGVVVVPSFAIGRTQELLFHLRRLQEAGDAPRIPIYIDSPMAVSVTDLYARAKEEHDDDMLLSVAEGRSELEPDDVTYVRDRETSKSLNSRSGPFMVIAGSGMATAGRIVHHLRRRLADASTTVLFTGYQGEGTLGRRLLEGAPEVRIMGEEIAVGARIERLNALSAHADRGEILAWLRGFAAPPRETFIVHGEPPAQDALAALIAAELGWRVSVPEYGERFDLV